MFIPRKKISLLDVLISLPIEPEGSMRHLLRERRFPPHLLLVPLCTLLVLVGPALWYQYRIQLHAVIPELQSSIAVTVILTILSFSFFMSVLLKLLLLNVSMFRVLAAVLYALAGLIPFMLAYYLGNFLASGEMTVLKYFATGQVESHDWFIEIFPICAHVALAYSFLLFVYGMKALTESKTLSALSMSVLGIPILIGSFAVSLTVADFIFRDTGIVVYRFFTGLLYPK